MSKNKILKLLAAVLISSGFAQTVVHAQETKEITVRSTENSVDSGTKVEAGDVIKVTDISGSFKGSSGHKTETYEGNTNTTKSSDYFEFGNAAEHSLVMWIDTPANHIQVRKHIATEVAAGGTLYFAINDGKGRYGDNEGDLKVTYEILKKSKVCSPPSDEKVEIKWTNKSGVPIRVNWVNFDCKEEKSDRLIKPDGVFDGTSYTGHLLRVRSEVGNDDLGVIIVKPDIATFNIVK